MNLTQNLRTVFGAATALTLAASLLAGSALPAHAAPAPESDPIVQGGPGGAYAPTTMLPLVESQLGLGGSLKAGEPATVGIPGLANGSALVRISALSPTKDLVINAAGAPALGTPAGVSASTTILVPVKAGKIALSTTQDTDIRVEVVSTFSDGDLGAGGTKALDAPINRADSTEAYGIGTAAGDQKVGVGVVGNGGVPSTDVRAAHVSVVANAGAEARISIEGVEQDLHAGLNVINTIANVSDLGTVDVTSDAPDTQVFVRGLVRGAAQNETTQSLDNGFNASVDAPIVRLDLAEDAPASVDLAAPTDATHVLVSVSATNASDSTFLQVGASAPSRGNGIITNPQAPTNNQIALAELDDQGLLPVSVRFGSADVSVKLLGSLAGDAKRSGSAAELVITSPEANAEVDLREVGTFTVAGEIATPNSSLDRVDVTADGQLIGTARAQRSATGYDISFQTSVPVSGGHHLEFEASFRDEAKTEADLKIFATLPDAGDTVISEDTVVHYGQDAADVEKITDNTILYSTDPGVLPGQLVVGRDSENAPEGYLRRVKAVEVSDGGYLVTTQTATLTEVFLQADVSEQVGLITYEGAQLFPQNTVTPSDIEVDTDAGTVSAAGAGLSRRAAELTGEVNSRVGESISLEVLLNFKKDHETQVDENDANHHRNKPQIKAAGGIQLSGKSELSVALVFELKVSVHFGWFQSPTASLDKFKVAVERSLETAVGANAFGSFEATWTKDLPNWNIGTVTFVLGPVPVVITSEAGVDLVAKVAAEVKAEISWTGKESQQYGFEYSDGQLHAVSPWPPVQNAPISIKNGYSLDESATAVVKGKASASVGPELEFQISIYDAAGPVVSAGALLGAAAEFETEKSIDWEIYLEGTIGVSVRLEVPIIDEVLLEATVVAEQKKKWDLLKGSIPWADFWKFDPEEETPGEEDGDEDEENIGLDPIEIPEFSFEGSSLRATLYWDNDDDLDLHMQQPDGEWINYRNRGPSSTGGFLDIDAFALCSPTEFPFPGGLENIYWQPESKAGPGAYLIEIDEYTRCGNEAPAKWVLKVYVDEKLRYQQSGNSEQQFSFNLQDGSNARSRMATTTEGVQELVPEDRAKRPEGTKTP